MFTASTKTHLKFEDPVFGLVTLFCDDNKLYLVGEEPDFYYITSNVLTLNLYCISNMLRVAQHRIICLCTVEMIL